MPRTVRGALVQASWTGDKESMIQKHEQRAHEAAEQGAQFILFQELFYGPYFCQVQDAQYYSYTELIPDGPTTVRMQDLAKQTGANKDDIVDLCAKVAEAGGGLMAFGAKTTEGERALIGDVAHALGDGAVERFKALFK